MDMRARAVQVRTQTPLSENCTSYIAEESTHNCLQRKKKQAPRRDYESHDDHDIDEPKKETS